MPVQNKGYSACIFLMFFYLHFRCIYLFFFLFLSPLAISFLTLFTYHFILYSGKMSNEQTVFHSRVISLDMLQRVCHRGVCTTWAITELQTSLLTLAPIGPFRAEAVSTSVRNTRQPNLARLSRDTLLRSWRIRFRLDQRNSPR